MKKRQELSTTLREELETRTSELDGEDYLTAIEQFENDHQGKRLEINCLDLKDTMAEHLSEHLVKKLRTFLNDTEKPVEESVRGTLTAIVDHGPVR